MKKEILYRDSSLFGSAVREVHSVIYHKVFVLGNTDIIYSCSRYMSGETKKAAERVLRDIEENGGCDIGEEGTAFVKALVKDIREQTGKEISYVLWLADLDVIMNCYHGDPDRIDGYETSDVILSDIMPDGRLYGYTGPQRPAIVSRYTMENGLLPETTYPGRGFTRTDV